MIKNKMSDILVEVDDNLKEMEKLISEQTFKVGDAQLFLERYFNIRRKMEQLEISRNLWRKKYEDLKQIFIKKECV